MEKRLNHNHTISDLDIKPTITEGSNATLDASDFVRIDAISDNADISYLWTKKSGPQITNLVDEKTKNPSFRVSYLENNDNFSAELVFILKITDSNGKSRDCDAKIKVKRVHRALILQGAV